MSAVIERVLARLAAPGAVLAPDPRGSGYGVYRNGDRRRRPVVRLDAAGVRALASDGAIEARGDAFVLNRAGAARVLRAAAPPEERFVAQHAPVVDRVVMDADGAARPARGLAQSSVLRRLAALRGADGAPWLTSAELEAAARVRADWEFGQIGLVRGSDWRAPPRGSAPRASGVDAAMAARCDARRRVEDALERLAPPLRRVIERICLQEEGVEALERAEGWPQRSGKLALKLALGQLALPR